VIEVGLPEFDSGRRQLPGAFGTDNTQTWLLVRLKEPEMPKARNLDLWRTIRGEFRMAARANTSVINRS